MKGGGEQREFGFITSKVVRPMRAGIGRTRRKIANKLYNPGNLLDKFENAHGIISTSKPQTVNKTLRNNLLRNEAPKAKTTVSYQAKDLARQGGGGSTLYKEKISDDVAKQMTNDRFLSKGDKSL